MVSHARSPNRDASPLVADVLALLKDVSTSGDQWRAKCPAHDDDRPSLSVSKGENGGVVICCHAGCQTEDVVKAIGLKMADLMPREGGSRRDNRSSGKQVRDYRYVDEHGTLLYRVVRFHPKQFRQCCPKPDGGWYWKLNGVRRVLYRLPELLAADRTKVVYLVEGEKDADRLAKLGLLATTNCGGAGKWCDDYNAALRGRHVVILPDNDRPGRKHAEQVAESLKGAVASVKIVALPGLPDKGDVSDWLNAGHTIDELQSLAAQMRDPNAVEFRRLTCRELDSSNFKIEYLVDQVLVAQQPAIIAGPEKTMKTTSLVDLSIAIATGGRWFGRFQVKRPARVAMFSGESGMGTLQETAQRIAKAAGHKLADIEGLFWYDRVPRCDDEQHLSALRSCLLADRAEVVIVDPTYLALPGMDASNLFLRGQQLRNVSELCQETGTTLLFCHHTRKGVPEPGKPTELQHIAWAGFGEFARQWILLSRREEYQRGSGLHRLWLNLGGSAGHSGLLAVDADEGPGNCAIRRRWAVSVHSAEDARQEKTARRQAKGNSLEADKAAVVELMSKYPKGETKAFLKDKLGMNGGKINKAMASLLEDGKVVECKVVKGNQATPWDAFKLVTHEAD